VRARNHVCKHVCALACMCTRMYVHSHVCALACMHTQAHTHTCTSRHDHANVCLHEHVHAFVHISTHTHTHSLSRMCACALAASDGAEEQSVAHLRLEKVKMLGHIHTIITNKHARTCIRIRGGTRLIQSSRIHAYIACMHVTCIRACAQKRIQS